MNKDITNELIRDVNTNYKELAKWLIALSTGAIVFSIKLVTTETLPIWRDLLAFSLGLLLISIIVGVRYVRLLIDFSGYNYQKIIGTRKIESFSELNPDSERLYNGVKHKVHEIISEFQKSLAEIDKKLNSISTDQGILFKWQQWLFYSGIVLLACFGIYNL